MHAMRSFEDDAEREGNFRYGLSDLYLAAEHIDNDPELREAALTTCDDLRKGCLNYLDFKIRFMKDSSDPSLDSGRRFVHNGIVTNLMIVTRILGGDFQKWYLDPAMNGGLNGEVPLEKGERIRRPRTEGWASKEALDFLKWQLALEDEKYGADNFEGSTAYAA